MAHHVLVVDDEANIREVFQRLLTTWGYRVSTAKTAEEGLQAMVLGSADIAIVDLRMPGRDGLWLAEQIRQRWPRTAIIMATGNDDLEVIERSKKLGAVDYVLKPFHHELLRQAMERATKAIEGA